MLRFLLSLILIIAQSLPTWAVPNTTQPPLTTLTVTTCSNHAPISGGGNGSPPQCDTQSVLLDQIGSAQGDLLYRDTNANGWKVLAPSTAGFVLTTQGAAANPQWSSVSGGSGCTVTGGASGQILTNNGSSGCSSNANATLATGALSLGVSGTAGSVKMGNATSGTVTIQPVTGALGTVTASLPANTGTLAELNLAETWTAVQTVTNSDLALLGSSTGATTFTSGNSSATNYTLTIPANTGTLAELNLAETWTAVQTVTNSDLALLGSSTGATTFTSGNSSATNYTLTIPANTGALAELNLAETWTAVQTVTNSDFALLGSSTGATTFTSGNSSATNYTLTIPANTGTLAELNLAQTWSAAQTFTNADLLLAGSSSGSTTLEAAATASGVATFPANTGTVAELNLAQTWTAVQTITNSDIALLGSSTGATTFTSANTGASNFTLTFPAVTDTIATLGTADQTLSGGVNLTSNNIGTVSSGTTTIDCGKNPSQYLTNGGSFTIAPPSNDGQCLIMITNNASAGTVSFSAGFSAGSNTGASLDTVNNHHFSVFIWRDNAIAGYSVYAHQ